MFGREALRNPDCFLEVNSLLNGTSFIKRNSKEIKTEFDNLCKQHMPKANYLATIKERCSWM